MPTYWAQVKATLKWSCKAVRATAGRLGWVRVWAALSRECYHIMISLQSLHSLYKLCVRPVSSIFCNNSFEFFSLDILKSKFVYVSLYKNSIFPITHIASCPNEINDIDKIIFTRGIEMSKFTISPLSTWSLNVQVVYNNITWIIMKIEDVLLKSTIKTTEF